jgi:hypothetical protein
MSSNDSNWWNSSVQDDFMPVISSRSRDNPYNNTGRGYSSSRGGGRTPYPGRGGLGVASQRGNKKYRGSTADLAERMQFESVKRLLELINNPDKMEKEIYGLNANIAGSPSLNEFS